MGTTNIKHNLEKPSKLHTETREQEKASSVPAGNDFCRFEWEGGGHHIYAFMQTSRVELPCQLNEIQATAQPGLQMLYFTWKHQIWIELL